LVAVVGQFFAKNREFEGTLSAGRQGDYSRVECERCHLVATLVPIVHRSAG
jgi:hypothetical protein